MWYTEATGLNSVPQERSASCLIIMMITRFNAGCKERPEGKGKFSGKERAAIGSASMTGIPCRIAEKQFDIGRTYYHELGKKSGLRVGKPARVGTDDGSGHCAEQSVPGATGCVADASGHARGEHRGLGGRCFLVFHFRRDDMEYAKGCVPENGNAGKERVSGEYQTYRRG